MHYLTLLLAYASLASSKYFITSPLGNTTWSVGGSATVTWNIKQEGPKANKLTVDLVAGPESRSQWVATICENLEPSAMTCFWPMIPSFITTLPSGYSVRIGYGLEPEVYDYSPKFKIFGSKMGSDDDLPRQPSPEACISNCGTDYIIRNPGDNANPTYNRRNDPRYNGTNEAAPKFSVQYGLLFISLLVGLLGL
jgi:hypothetical protein